MKALLISGVKKSQENSINFISGHHRKVAEADWVFGRTTPYSVYCKVLKNRFGKVGMSIRVKNLKELFPVEEIEVK